MNPVSYFKNNKLELLSLLGGICEVIQMYLLGSHNVIGFIFGGCASISWMSYAFTTKKAIGLWFIAPVGLILNIRGWLLW